MIQPSHRLQRGLRFVLSLATSMCVGVAAQAQKAVGDDGAPPPSEAILLAQIEESLNRIDTLRAEFVQTSQDGQVRHGTLSLDRPGKLRFEYTDGTPLLLVSDGTVLTFVDYDIGQVSRWPIEDTALGLLVEEQIDLAGDKRVIDVETDSASGSVKVTAQDPERPEEGTLTLLFDRSAASVALEGWRIVDSRGAITSVQLRDKRINLALADESLWRFEDPRKLPSQRRRRRR